jgi:hypothetical protein
VVIGPVVLAAAVYIKRQGLERAAIAFRLYHVHIFARPPMADECGWSQFEESNQLYWDFAASAMAREARALSMMFFLTVAR